MGCTSAEAHTSSRTPVVGLGCQSGSYLIYGLVSTIAWLILCQAAYLSRLHSLRLESSHIKSQARLRPSSLLAASAVIMRLVGKSLAAANAVFIIATSIIQFTGLYDNCELNFGHLPPASCLPWELQSLLGYYWESTLQHFRRQVSLCVFLIGEMMLTLECVRLV